MYATCLFCSSALGRNEGIEHFPVGRRLAYDAATGRLWVVCMACERWNLSPLETRWEAIEEAERVFRSTPLRVSSDNIALAQLSEGLELVRIGRPPRLEFAAWRYGDQFGKRRRKALIVRTAGGVGGLIPLLNVAASQYSASVSTAVGLGVATTIAALTVAHISVDAVRTWRTKSVPQLAVRDNSGALLRLTHANIAEAVMVRKWNSEWQLKVPHVEVMPAGRFARLLGHQHEASTEPERTALTGDAALRALATLLPLVNGSGAGKRDIGHAVDVIRDSPSLEHLLHRAAGSVEGNRKRTDVDPGERPMNRLPLPVRLALEMTLHEDDEERAMQGALYELEARWRDADDIAKISDALLLPADIDAGLAALRERNASVR